ncbi:MAG: hypothetical protein GXN92_00345 [Candidatus Micrarchaeota archaeon]|nr:hypothetical protein [Candidatus Micrarchaeota archaeon]
MLKEYLEIYFLNKQKNKWLHSRTFSDLKKQLLMELEELEKALASGNKKEIICELGDVLMDALNIVAWVTLKYGIKEEEVLQASVKKQKHRKPWLFSDQDLSEEEQVRIWYEQKEKEEC